VTSGAQYFGRIRWHDLAWQEKYDRFGAYSQSKLANVMFALELDARLKRSGSGIRSLAAHPGMALTNLQRSNLTPESNQLEHLAVKLFDPLLQSASMGALPQLHAATASSAASGDHFGPDRFGGLRGHPTRCRVAPAARDSNQRERLWSVSEELIQA
jgi:protochlorophyllide reductase